MDPLKIEIPGFDHDLFMSGLFVSVFIYSLPGFKCSIKERMLYSSCKSPLVEQLEAKGVTIEKKVRPVAGEATDSRTTDLKFHLGQGILGKEFGFQF